METKYLFLFCPEQLSEYVVIVLILSLNRVLKKLKTHEATSHELLLATVSFHK
jgi:hypothetical protein